MKRKTPKQIEKLRKKVELFDMALLEAVKSGKQDKRDSDLANLIGTPGWDTVENFFERLICELLVPEPFDIDPVAYAIRNQAKLIAINAMEEVVESVRNADTRIRATKIPQPKQTSGESE